MKQGHVPTARLAPIIELLMKERWPHVDACDELGLKAGCDKSTIRRIIEQRNPGVSFDLADSLLCALGRADLWWGELNDIYKDLRFHETCALPSCGRTFPESDRSGKPKRFCSDNCRSLYHKTSAGKATGNRYVQRGRCFKGHKVTPENTIVIRLKDGTTRKQCRACKLASMAAYKRKRRREDPSWNAQNNARRRAQRAARKAAA